MSARRRIVFLQLPVPRQTAGEPTGNVPLAGAVLAEALVSGASGREWAPVVLGQGELDRLGDAGLAARIAALDPAVVGFTLFSWNLWRSISLARRLRTLLPEVRLIAGGPEVVPGNPRLEGEGIWDHLVVGEGEAVLPGLLECLGDGERPANRWVAGQEYGRFAAAAPYAAGTMPETLESFLPVETARGCPFDCAYCAYAGRRSRVRHRSREAVLADLQAVAARGIEEAYLLDPTLNAGRDLEALVELLAAGRRVGIRRYHAELRADLLRPGDAARLAEAGLRSVEVGLQTVNPETARRCGRPQDLKRFAAGARALAAAGVRVEVDLIAGLPGDRLEDLRAGMRFLVEEGLAEHALVFPLALLPGSRLRQRAAELGLRHDPHPPYHVRETQEMTPEDLAAVWELADELLGLEFDAQSYPLPLAGNPHCVLDLRRGSGEPARAARELPPEAVPAQLAVLVRCRKIRDLADPSLRRLLHRWQEANPHGQLDLLAAPESLPDDRELAAALQLLRPTPRHYLDRYLSFGPGPISVVSRRLILVCNEEQLRRDPERLAALGSILPLAWERPSSPAWREPAEEIPNVVGALVADPEETAPPGDRARRHEKQS
jgi:hypothetical protein